MIFFAASAIRGLEEGTGRPVLLEAAEEVEEAAYSPAVVGFFSESVDVILMRLLPLLLATGSDEIDEGALVDVEVDEDGFEDVAFSSEKTLKLSMIRNVVYCNPRSRGWTVFI